MNSRIVTESIQFCVVGAVLCVFITSPYHSHLQLLLDQYDLPSFPELDWASLESEWTRLRSQIPEPWKLNNDGREFLVGEIMQARGLKPEHPIVLIPGVISTVSNDVFNERICMRGIPPSGSRIMVNVSRVSKLFP